eukprot:1149518-Pelagomonas_calceolata.AAC.1
MVTKGFIESRIREKKVRLHSPSQAACIKERPVRQDLTTQTKRKRKYRGKVRSGQVQRSTPASWPPPWDLQYDGQAGTVHQAQDPPLRIG